MSAPTTPPTREHPRFYLDEEPPVRLGRVVWGQVRSYQQVLRIIRQLDQLSLLRNGLVGIWWRIFIANRVEAFPLDAGKIRVRLWLQRIIFSTMQSSPVRPSDCCVIACGHRTKMFGDPVLVCIRSNTVWSQNCIIWCSEIVAWTVLIALWRETYLGPVKKQVMHERSEVNRGRQRNT